MIVQLQNPSQILKYLYCNKIIWHCIIISPLKLLHSNILILWFAKGYRTLSCISKISLYFQVWLYALRLFFFSNLQNTFFFHYRRITFSRLSLKMIYISQNNTFSNLSCFFLTLSILFVYVCVCVCVCVAGVGRGLWAVSKVESLARIPCLPRFIRLASFSDTLLVVSILDTVYDCHLTLLLQSWRG